jgi:methyl-accepting chemotaxis protein
VAAVQAIGASIAEVHEIATAVAAAIEEQQSATIEISRSIAQAAEGTEQVKASVAHVQAAAATTDQASGDVLSAGQELSHQSQRLQAEIDRFLAGVCAA